MIKMKGSSIKNKNIWKSLYLWIVSLNYYNIGVVSNIKKKWISASHLNGDITDLKREESLNLSERTSDKKFSDLQEPIDHKNDSIESRIWNLRPILTDSSKLLKSSLIQTTKDNLKSKKVMTKKKVHPKPNESLDELSSFDNFGDLIPALSNLNMNKMKEIDAKSKYRIDETRNQKKSQLNEYKNLINQPNIFQDAHYTDYPSSSLLTGQLSKIMKIIF